MIAQRKKPFGNDTESISRQISRAVNRLDQRRRTASALGSSIGSRIRSKIASPGGLWIAGGAGFLLAEWIHRPTTGPHLARKQPSKPPISSQTAAMANAALLLRFALDLKMLWQKKDRGKAAAAEVAETDVAE